MKDPQTEASPGEHIDPTFFTLDKRASTPGSTLTKILLVQFRNGEAVDKHPELAELLDEGWTIRSAVPRIVESEGTKLLVVLARPHSGSRTKTIRAKNWPSSPQFAG